MCLSHLNFTNLTKQRNVFFPQYYIHVDFQYRKAKHTVFIILFSFHIVFLTICLNVFIVGTATTANVSL